RLSNHQQEMKRPVQVVIIDLSGSQPVVEKIKLKSAPPGSDVLDRSRLEEAAFREQKLAGYMAEVKAAGSYQRTDVRVLLEEIAKAEKLPVKVIKEAVRRIALAEESLAQGDDQL
ncbi:MAG TPA: serine/threonine protein phosphatase, partial [Syntrophaceticus sp.]|nr:serine/threonine protein phosphatase [Syntrophaceticus sp.]